MSSESLKRCGERVRISEEIQKLDKRRKELEDQMKPLLEQKDREKKFVDDVRAMSEDKLRALLKEIVKREGGWLENKITIEYRTKKGKMYEQSGYAEQGTERPGPRATLSTLLVRIYENDPDGCDQAYEKFIDDGGAGV